LVKNLLELHAKKSWEAEGAVITGKEPSIGAGASGIYTIFHKHQRTTNGGKRRRSKAKKGK